MTNKKILTLISFLLLFSFLLVGCKVVNQPPEITSAPVLTATVGVDYTYNVVATDPNPGDVLTYSLTTEPEGMLINPDSGVITWEADDITAAGVGDYDVVVVVSDEGGLSDSQDFTITVSEFVVELIRIEVDPETMTLTDVSGPKTFEVTAHYNDDTTPVVTSTCVYGISDTSIAKVDKDIGEVTALKVGTATISINYTEEGITKGTTLTVIVEGTITVRWLEDAVRFHPDGSIKQTWQNELIPPFDPTDPTKSFPPATLILTGGGYCFADIKEYYNIHINVCLDLEGSVVIDEAGQLSGWATYNLEDLDTKNDFAGQVEIIIGEKSQEDFPDDPGDYDGIIVGTYTQWKYVYAESDGELEILAKIYPKAVLAPEQGLGWWLTSRTEYIAHGWLEPPG